MSTVSQPVPGGVTAPKHRTPAIETTTGPVAMNTPQKMGTRLWAPTFLMALIGFGIAIVLAAIRAGEVDGGSVADLETLRHLVPGFMFLGFTAVFASVSFAIARILGVFRVGGGKIQDDIGKGVHTLKMPATAKAMLGLMMIGMIAVALGAIAHLVVGFRIGDGSESELATSERWFLFSEGIRRLGVGMYLLGITFGLVTIVQVVKFQSARIRELV
ncbi:MAG: hypothetical protein ACR2P0_02765 [Acidimicrobiales bacterium]